MNIIIVPASVVCASRLSRRKDQRRHLVVVIGGDKFDASTWMTDPEHATWDLYLIYYGEDPNLRCALCTKVRCPGWVAGAGRAAPGERHCHYAVVALSALLTAPPCP